MVVDEGESRDRNRERIIELLNSTLVVVLHYLCHVVVATNVARKGGLALHGVIRKAKWPMHKARCSSARFCRIALRGHKYGHDLDTVVRKPINANP